MPSENDGRIASPEEQFSVVDQFEEDRLQLERFGLQRTGFRVMGTGFSPYILSRNIRGL
jgi:hypothetical protein